jgi:hypothetical protein
VAPSIDLRRALKRTAILVLLGFFSSVCVGQPKSDNRSGIEGVITVGNPHGGPARDSVPHVRPLGNIAFLVTNEKGLVTRFSTDEQGRFQVFIAPGRYKISKEQSDNHQPGFYGPFDVEVEKDKMTVVQWNCDDGRM